VLGQYNNNLAITGLLPISVYAYSLVWGCKHLLCLAKIKVKYLT
jgi:hypothetical protein